jgi:PIN domain
VSPVVADADTLFGATTRALLIHLDYQGLIRLHWSPLILDEMSRALVSTGRKHDAVAARLHERLMRTSLPSAEISTVEVQAQFAAVAGAMRSVKDTHVAACAHAILANGYYPHTTVVHLVTHNIRDFGVQKLAAIGIEVRRPDTFLSTLAGLNLDGVGAAFMALRGTLRSNPSPESLLDRLASDGQELTAGTLLKSWRNGLIAL